MTTGYLSIEGVNIIVLILLKGTINPDLASLLMAVTITLFISGAYTMKCLL